MSYDPRLLFAQICVRLDETPARSLFDLSREFHVGARAIQDVVASMTGGKKFSSFKDDILIARLTRLFVARPGSPLKEISCDLGYKSVRTFARAVRRGTGASPAEFRNRLVAKAASRRTRTLKASTAIH
jgi:AraC-like DNA-binding protein